MTIQEQIREVIDTYTDDGCLYPDKDCAWRRRSKEGYCASGDDSYTCLMKRLGELGGVIKVDKELSTIKEIFPAGGVPKAFAKGMDYYRCFLVGASIGFFEPLIEEK